MNAKGSVNFYQFTLVLFDLGSDYIGQAGRNLFIFPAYTSYVLELQVWVCHRIGSTDFLIQYKLSSQEICLFVIFTPLK